MRDLPIGIFGGTFDPIHYGHLRTALELLETLELAQVRFIPCCIPAHRGLPGVTATQRLTLVRLALHNQPKLIADDRELCRPGPSYTEDTLASLREEFGAQVPLCLIVGSDAFRELHTWKNWQHLTDLAHIVVMQRPGVSQNIVPELETFIAPRLTEQALELHCKPAGSVLFQPVTQLNISATLIRNRLAQGKSPRYLLPDAVLDYIHQQALYRAPPTSELTH